MQETDREDKSSMSKLVLAALKLSASTIEMANEEIEQIKNRLNKLESFKINLSNDQELGKEVRKFFEEKLINTEDEVINLKKD